MVDVNKIICGDCLEVMKEIPDKSVNLIIADPPYNINKADWDKIPNYIEWLGKRLLEMQRVLKDNGSFYLFHNDFLQMVEIQNWINNNSKFVFKQLIVWNKKFEGVNNEGYLQGYNEVEGLRNYQKMAEYILFYTFQDETGLTTIFSEEKLFQPIKKYLIGEKKKSRLTNKQYNLLFSNFTNKKGCIDRSVIEHYWQTSQWCFPTKEIYENVLQETGCFQREYESLRQEYESLRQEYESLRYTFNNQKSHHSVWNYEIADRVDHITPKPIPLIKNILKHSSNEGDIVLIPFVGSGNDCIACKELNRNYIGIEISEDYCEIARRRIMAIPELLF